MLWEAVSIALAAIWGSKLRSFMTVLGNIVAVMSIIAVVSLIQGMNGYVGDAFMREVGAGTFRIDRIGVVTDEEKEEQAQRRNPQVTLNDVRAVRGFSPLFSSVMAEAGTGASVSRRDVTVENVRVRGVSSEYQDFSGYSTVLGRLPSPL